MKLMCKECRRPLVLTRHLIRGKGVTKRWECPLHGCIPCKQRTRAA